MTWTWSPAQLCALGRYLSDRGFCGPEVTARRVGDGHSNLTFLIEDGERCVVVRRPPPSPVPAGAHDVVREAQIVAALAETVIPVPRILAIVQAGEILEVPLVVTEFVDGVIITESTPPPLNTPGIRREIAESAIDTLAQLHQVDWRAAGLGRFGKPLGFNQRHLKRVSALIVDTEGQLPVVFATLANWLTENIPVESSTSLLHNDFRIGNLMIHGEAPGRVATVLDWELATIGDPLFDLGYFISSYPQLGEPLTPTTKMGTAALEDGYPTRRELIDRYVQQMAVSVSGLEWYCALAQYKLAALYEYGRRRAVDTTGGDPYFASADHVQAFLLAGQAFAQA